MATVLCVVSMSNSKEHKPEMLSEFLARMKKDHYLFNGEAQVWPVESLVGHPENRAPNIPYIRVLGKKVYTEGTVADYVPVIVAQIPKVGKESELWLAVRPRYQRRGMPTIDPRGIRGGGLNGQHLTLYYILAKEAEFNKSRGLPYDKDFLPNPKCAGTRNILEVGIRVIGLDPNLAGPDLRRLRNHFNAISNRTT